MSSTAAVEAPASAGTASADPGKERRSASGIPIVPAVDGFRGIAILGIVVLHTLQNVGIYWGPDGSRIQRALWAGDLGQTCLDCLFVISGFVIFLPAASRGGDLGSLRAFAIRRAARLFPAYWAVLLLMLVLIAVLPLGIAMPGPGEMALTFTTFEVPAEFIRFQYNLGFDFNRALWTLSLDVTFYFLLVLFAARYFRRPWRGLAIGAAVGIAWRLLFNHLDFVGSNLGLDPSPAAIQQLFITSEIQFPFWAYSFAVGMTCAWLYVKLEAHRARDGIVRRAPLLQLGSLLAILLLVIVVMHYEVGAARHSPWVMLVYTSAIGAFILSTSVAPRWLQSPFSNRLARWLGDISYGIYLIHLVLIGCLANLASLPRGTFGAALLWCAIVVPGAILWGYLSARFLERPIRLWAQRYLRRTSGPGPQEPSQPNIILPSGR